jgi:hypothetical protein
MDLLKLTGEVVSMLEAEPSMNDKDTNARPRELTAMQLRYQGKSFREIGDALGISSAGARELFQTGERMVTAAKFQMNAMAISAEELGLERHPVLVHPEDWKAVSALIYALRRKRVQAFMLRETEPSSVRAEQKPTA